jgi:hypothetical protein
MSFEPNTRFEEAKYEAELEAEELEKSDKFASIVLSEQTLRKLQRSGLLKRSELRQVNQELRYFEDERRLKKNRVKEVPIPKGYTAFPHRKFQF